MAIPAPSRSWRRTIGVSALFIALTGMMTWPQPLVLATHATDHPDIYFNLWRIRWIHHALSTSPSNLFNGNQFYPERQVLAFSDAMLVEGIVAAPLLALGLPPVLMHNLLLLGAIAASGVGAFVLARHVSGSSAAGVAAGIILPSRHRFDHYMHMELQWAIWIPWAFWALQRTFETGAVKFGALTGVFCALQLMSSIYYGSSRDAARTRRLLAADRPSCAARSDNATAAGDWCGHRRDRVRRVLGSVFRRINARRFAQRVRGQNVQREASQLSVRH
jgi:hypothetical protein